MKPIDRNPDINLDAEEIPAGMQLIAGKNLMHTARACGVPFGVAKQTLLVFYGRRQTSRVTAGLIIRDADVPRFTAALGRKTGGAK